MAKDNKQPLVSVIITNYNYEKFIGEAIESVLNQTYDNIELIIIDDGSTDGSRDIIEVYASKNKHIRFLKQSNKGVVPTRNRGLELAKGKYIVFLDSDDILPKNYLQATVASAERGSLDIVYTDFIRFGSEDIKSDFPEFDIESLKSGNYVHMSALIKKSSVDDLSFDSNLNRLSHEDWDFFLGAALKGLKFAKNTDTQLMYRSHGESRNLDTSAGVDEYVLRLLKTRLYIVDKYKKLYPGKIDLTAPPEFVSWFNLSKERLSMLNQQHVLIEEKDRQIAERDKVIKEKDQQIEDVIKSIRYKVGKVVILPLSTIKNIATRGNKL